MDFVIPEIPPVDTPACKAAVRRVERKKDELQRAIDLFQEKCGEEAQQRHLRFMAAQARLEGPGGDDDPPPVVNPEDPVFDNEGVEVPRSVGDGSVVSLDDTSSFCPLSLASSGSSGSSSATSVREQGRPVRQIILDDGDDGTGSVFTLGYNDVIDNLPLVPAGDDVISISSGSTGSGSVMSSLINGSGSSSSGSSSASSVRPAGRPNRPVINGSVSSGSSGSSASSVRPAGRPNRPVINDDGSESEYTYVSIPSSTSSSSSASSVRPVGRPNRPVINDDGSESEYTYVSAPSSVSSGSEYTFVSESSAAPSAAASARSYVNPLPPIPEVNNPDYADWWAEVCRICKERDQNQRVFESEQRQMQGSSSSSSSSSSAESVTPRPRPRLYQERVAAAAAAVPYASYPPMAPGYSCPPCVNPRQVPQRRQMTVEEFNRLYPPVDDLESSISHSEWDRYSNPDGYSVRWGTDNRPNRGVDWKSDAGGGVDYSRLPMYNRPVPSVYVNDVDDVSTLGGVSLGSVRPVSTDRYPVNLGRRQRGDGSSVTSSRPLNRPRTGGSIVVAPVAPEVFEGPEEPPLDFEDLGPDPDPVVEDVDDESVESVEVPRPVSTDRYPIDLGKRRRGDSESVVSGRPARQAQRLRVRGVDPDYPGVFASTRQQQPYDMPRTRASGLGDDLSLSSQLSETGSRVRIPRDGDLVDRVEYIPVGGVPGTNGSYITDEDVYQGLSNLLVWACKPMKAYRVSKEGFEGGEPKRTPVVDIGIKNIWNPTGTLGVGGLYLLRFDGVSDTDPGVAGAGVALYDVDGEEFWFGFKKLGNAVTKSIAEYCAMIYGMKAALSLGVKNIIIESDSNLVVKQMNGVWEVKNPTLKKFYVCIQKWIAKFDYMEVRYIKTSTNTRANWLAKNANDLS